MPTASTKAAALHAQSFHQPHSPAVPTRCFVRALALQIKPMCSRYPASLHGWKRRGIEPHRREEQRSTDCNRDVALAGANTLRTYFGGQQPPFHIICATLADLSDLRIGYPGRNHAARCFASQLFTPACSATALYMRSRFGQ